MASDVAWSRAALLGRAAELLAAAGIAEPRREAYRLWHDLTGSRAAEALLRERPVDPELADRLLGAVGRRAAGAPLAYASGVAGFRHLVLQCDGRALIPRPETEGLVDLVLARVRTGRVADVGTGTGALALSLAGEGGFDQVIAIDDSAEALALAAANRRAAGVEVALLRGDLCTSLGTASLDALVSNPPYLTEAEYAGLEPAVRAWEPAPALVSGPDGMQATRRLLQDGSRVLRPGGLLVVEVDCSRAAAGAGLAVGLGWDDVAIHADLFGRERYLLARRSSTP